MIAFAKHLFSCTLQTHIQMAVAAYGYDGYMSIPNFVAEVSSHEVPENVNHSDWDSVFNKYYTISWEANTILSKPVSVLTSFSVAFHQLKNFPCRLNLSSAEKQI